jgi:hypothetical protein
MPEEKRSEEYQTHDYDDTQGHTYGLAPVPILIRHGDHVDVLQGGHLHWLREDGSLEEHTIPISERNPADCTHGHFEPGIGLGHEPGHRHGPECGHPEVPHGGHIDYLVDGRLHFPHGDHCDDHGPVEIVR